MKGLVITVFGKYYTVENDGTRYTCVLTGKHRLREDRNRFTEPVAVGDSVEFTPGEGNNTCSIEEVNKRKNVFTRKDRGRSKEDLIAANLDQILVVQSFNRPKLNLRFVDRVFVRGVKEGIPVSLCVNKADLAGDDEAEWVMSYYSQSRMPVHIVSAVEGRGIDELRSVLEGNTTLFIGSSGVGKSTLLNRLYPELNLRTSRISESTGKGKHTTTNVEMVTLPGGARVLDTPGLREFGLLDIRPEELGLYFEDYRRISGKCRFNPCTHDHEPGCEVKKKVERGKFDGERYVSYINILRSLQEYYDTRY